MSFEEKFKKLKEIIKTTPNKKSLITPSFISFNDNFEIISALYLSGITCNDVSKIDDIYNVVKQKKLDPSLFNNPYYIMVRLSSFNEETIDVINKLDNNTFVEIDIVDNLDKNNFPIVSKINHPNCLFKLRGWIDINCFYTLSTKYSIDRESDPVIVIDGIDDNTVKKMNYIHSNINNIRFRITIKDIKSLYNLYKYVSDMPDNEILLVLDNDIFNQNKHQGARDLIFEDYKELELKKDNVKILYQNMEYNDINQIYELERNLELIRSHIPSNASELDIVTYVSLFIINYFKYDYKMIKEKPSEKSEKDINLSQFVSRGEGVCRHFASFTKCFLNSLGIECEKVDGINHAFNVVKIDGKMYFLDNTWLAGHIQNKEVKTLAESSDYLRSNASFEHSEYYDVLKKYNCEEYDRNKIIDSVKRVTSWRKNYQIHIQALKDLFRKYKIKNENSIDNKIEAAIPRRR